MTRRCVIPSPVRSIYWQSYQRRIYGFWCPGQDFQTVPLPWMIAVLPLDLRVTVVKKCDPTWGYNNPKSTTSRLEQIQATSLDLTQFVWLESTSSSNDLVVFSISHPHAPLQRHSRWEIERYCSCCVVAVRVNVSPFRNRSTSVFFVLSFLTLLVN